MDQFVFCLILILILVYIIGHTLIINVEASSLNWSFENPHFTVLLEFCKKFINAFQEFGEFGDFIHFPKKLSSAPENGCERGNADIMSHLFFGIVHVEAKRQAKRTLVP